MKIKDEKTGKIKDVRLPKAFKKKWLKALRSDKYKQGKYVLEDTDHNFCCLGVACRIVHPKLKLTNISFISKEKFSTRIKSIKVPEILKGYNEEGESEYSVIVDKLTKMNDNGRSFKYIAKWVERYL